MSNPGYWDVQSNPKAHKGEVELDPNVEAQLLQFGAIAKSYHGHGASNWNTTAKINAEINGKKIFYFLKLTNEPNACPMFEGEYESLKLINKIIPKFSPEPLAWGKCKGLAEKPDEYFIMFTFHPLLKGNPPVPRFAEAVAQLHTLSMREYATANPDGKFGFHITTYNGTLAQDNTWTRTWEEFFIRGMRRMLALEEISGGPNEQLQELSKPFFDKVIPRLLRPLETAGRSIKPVLLHGDLWLGNVSVKEGSEDQDPLMFDASAFWGHNEYELATMRPLENEWAEEYYRAYHKLIPKSEPIDDWDARNALYATRVIIHDAALYPEKPHFRDMLIKEIQKLVDQFSLI
ncbi:hypothetical protein QQS21_005180 [Conoideocrella luteorostrata]|uniref:protein-ribulosamine 3-kinase n=1 Tax=Conoideocrella luteorostrata TaxID=1105319 RepID=A0AAJ0CR00_9HYPO|nr:hypothetical protein QQS21_005180 [Conoideocrella luteorostrata]